MRSLTRPGTTLLALLLFAGRAVNAQSETKPLPGTVIVVEGIGGWNVMGPVARASLQHAGVPHDVHEFRWSHGFGQLLKDLQDTRHLLSKSEELAEWVKRLRDQHPDRPIYLIGHSAGTGLIVRAAELTPPGTIDRLILLSSALSPTYDLRPALAAVRQGIVSFHSPHDRFYLDWGTRQFGTVDRHFTPSAGLRGFQVPEQLHDADRILYRRLVQVPWRRHMILECNVGGHNGPCYPGFLIGEVAPWLRSEFAPASPSLRPVVNPLSLRK